MYSIEWPSPKGKPDMRGFAEPESLDEELCDHLVVSMMQHGERHFRVTVDFAAAAPAPNVRIELFRPWWQRWLWMRGVPFMLTSRYGTPGFKIGEHRLNELRFATEVKGAPKPART